MNHELVVESRDGTGLAVSRVGSGPSLVLVHGGIVSKESWAPVAALLAEWHDVWSYDRRGVGGSGRPADNSLDREVEDLAAIVGAAGSAVHLVGHSDGALLCLEVATDRPQLHSLVLYEPTVHFDRREDAFQRAIAMLDSDDLDGFLAVFMTEIAAASDDEVAMLRSIPEVWAMLVDGAHSYRTHSDAFAGRIADFVAAGWRPERYRSVTVPTRLLRGALTQSPLFATADDIRDAIPHADVATLAGQGHMAAAFDPTGLANAIRSFTAAHS
jgi:pimeloyl-ACP methyl ester carboxylesterase